VCNTLSTETKSSVLADLSKVVLGYCDTGEIEGEIDESETVTAKIMGYKAKRDCTKEMNESSHTSEPDMNQHLWELSHTSPSSLCRPSEVMLHDRCPLGFLQFCYPHQILTNSIIYKDC